MKNPQRLTTDHDDSEARTERGTLLVARQLKLNERVSRETHAYSCWSSNRGK